ncbi:Ferroporti-1 [Hypoxylon trugodes]|uniref:Ferroporti-1 n=1 Tax=Hypoxylon trugodes TaxID=326681 RepID=UPI00219D78BB|nr:Ferroporti-1 [Hypoxylon trugodes]KAI1390758.1 Ferroporti-1 [Hypoxylon trugodes]
MNLVSVEKDWTVVVSGKHESALLTLNAQLRRIDLMCKLVGPLFIALIDGYSTKLALIVNFGLNIASVPVEYYSIARVYYDVSELQVPKTTQPTDIPCDSDHDSERVRMFARQRRNSQAVVTRFISDFAFYIHHPVFLASFAESLRYLTVLSFAGQMVTFLVISGYSSTQVGIARTVSVAFKVLATWVAPLLIIRIGPLRAGL